jgi:hypothetical protein
MAAMENAEKTSPISARPFATLDEAIAPARCAFRGRSINGSDVVTMNARKPSVSPVDILLCRSQAIRPLATLPAIGDASFTASRFIPLLRKVATMPRPIHFEIHAENPDRAIRFYTDLFGWQFKKWEGPMPYWVVTTGTDPSPGINGGLMKRMGSNPDPKLPLPVVSYVCTMDVPNVDQYVTKATQLGGIVALPKMPIPGVGWLAYCKDSEGNIFGMMQNDPNAK